MQFCTNTDNESTNRLVDSLHIGEPNNSYNHKQQQHIFLELEPDNQYDPNAVRIVLVSGGGGQTGETMPYVNMKQKIGYISKKKNEEV